MNPTATSPAPQSSVLPYVITGVLLSFACYIGFLVYGTMQSEVNLVSKEYYAEELVYSQRMQQVKQAQQLDNPITVISAVAAEQLVLQFPAELAGATGTVHLFRPSDFKLDVVLPLKLNSDGLQHINTASLKNGLWRVQVTGMADGKEYYHAQDVTL